MSFGPWEPSSLIYASYRYRRDYVAALPHPGWERQLRREPWAAACEPGRLPGLSPEADPPDMKQAIAWELAVQAMTEDQVRSCLEGAGWWADGKPAPSSAVRSARSRGPCVGVPWAMSPTGPGSCRVRPFPPHPSLNSPGGAGRSCLPGWSPGPASPTSTPASPSASAARSSSSSPCTPSPTPGARPSTCTASEYQTPTWRWCREVEVRVLSRVALGAGGGVGSRSRGQRVGAGRERVEARGGDAPPGDTRPSPTTLPPIGQHPPQLPPRTPPCPQARCTWQGSGTTAGCGAAAWLRRRRRWAGPWPPGRPVRARRGCGP